MSGDAQMVELLDVVQDGDTTGELVDNAFIAARLGWDLAVVAGCLHEAKERSLIWGRRSGEKPEPWFNELEITVQGRRLLRAHTESGSDRTA